MEVTRTAHQQVRIEVAGLKINHDLLTGLKAGRVAIHVLTAAEGLVALFQSPLLYPVPATAPKKAAS